MCPIKYACLYFQHEEWVSVRIINIFLRPCSRNPPRPPFDPLFIACGAHTCLYLCIHKLFMLLTVPQCDVYMSGFPLCHLTPFNQTPDSGTELKPFSKGLAVTMVTVEVCDPPTSWRIQCCLVFFFFSWESINFVLIYLPLLGFCSCAEVHVLIALTFNSGDWEIVKIGHRVQGFFHHLSALKISTLLIQYSLQNLLHYHFHTSAVQYGDDSWLMLNYQEICKWSKSDNTMVFRKCWVDMRERLCSKKMLAVFMGYTRTAVF